LVQPVAVEQTHYYIIVKMLWTRKSGASCKDLNLASLQKP